MPVRIERRTIKSNVGRWAGRFNDMKNKMYSSDFFHEEQAISLENFLGKLEGEKPRPSGASI